MPQAFFYMESGGPKAVVEQKAVQAQVEEPKPEPQPQQMIPGFYPVSPTPSYAPTTMPSWVKEKLPRDVQLQLEAVEMAKREQYERQLALQKARETWMATTLTGQVYKATAHVPESFKKASEMIPELKVAKSPFYYPEGILAGGVAAFESYIRPEIPSPIAATVEKYVYKIEGWHTEQLEKLGPGYSIGYAGGMFAQYLLMSKATGLAAKGFEKISQIKHERYIRDVAKQVHQWGEAEFLQPAAYEFSEQFSKAYKYVGYPVLHRAPYSVIQVTKPTAWVQIQRAIERGMLPMAGQVAQTVPVWSKATVDIAAKAAFYGAEYTAKAAVSLTPALTGLAVTVPLAKELSRLEPPRKTYEPEVQRLYEKAELVSPQEQEQKTAAIFKTYQVQLQRLYEKPELVSRLEPKERVSLIPALALQPAQEPLQKQVALQRLETTQIQEQRQIQKQVQKQMQALQMVTPTRLIGQFGVSYPKFPSYAFGPSRKRRLRGGWFEKKWPIPEPEEVFKRAFGKDLAQVIGMRRKKRKAQRRR